MTQLNERLQNVRKSLETKYKTKEEVDQMLYDAEYAYQEVYISYIASKFKD